LERLRRAGVDVAWDDYPIDNLKGYNNFNYFFQKFSNPEIKAQLLFYCKQLEDIEAG